MSSAPGPRPEGLSIALPCVRRTSRKVTLVPKPPEPVVTTRPLRVARMLAMAHQIERLIATGEFAERTDAARKLGFTKARISQLLNLTLLAPDIQERLLLACTESGTDPVSERDLRPVLAARSWADQRAELSAGRCPWWGM